MIKDIFAYFGVLCALGILAGLIGFLMAAADNRRFRPGRAEKGPRWNH